MLFDFKHKIRYVKLQLMSNDIPTILAQNHLTIIMIPLAEV